MSEIFNCWQCKHYSVMDNMCRRVHLKVLSNDPICERFVLDDACKHDPKIGKRFMLNDACKHDPKTVKKQESASDRIALIAKEIEWLRLDPGCHDRMLYDSLSTIETMMKHLSTSIKGTERDFMMEVVASE